MLGKNYKIKIRSLVFTSLMIALSVIIGLICKRFLTFGAIRITLENLPVLLAGFLLGPIYGAVAGASADMISAPLSGFGINPIITVGAASIGAVAGLFSRYIIKRKEFLAILLSALSAHAVGSMLIKSVGLWLSGYAFQLCLLRIPLYLVIGTLEAYLAFVVLKNNRMQTLTKGALK